MKLSFYLGVFVLKHISDWKLPISVAGALVVSCAMDGISWLSCLKCNCKFYRTFLDGGFLLLFIFFLVFSPGPGFPAGSFSLPQAASALFPSCWVVRAWT